MEPEGSLIIAVPTVAFPILAPGKIGCTTQDQLHFWGVYDTALTWDFDTPEFTTDALAESWSYDSSNTVLTFRIRKGIPFHGGWGEVNAEDWKWSFDMQHIEGSLHSNIFVSKEFTKEVKVIDPYTVEHHLTEPNTLYIYKFEGNHGCGAFTIFNKNRIDTLGMEKAELDMTGGHGPFKFTKWVAGDEIVVEAVPDHYRQTSQYERVYVLEIPEAATRVAALLTGEVDITDLPTNEVARAERSGLNALVLKGDGDIHLMPQGRFCYEPLGIPDGKGNPVPARDAYDPDLPWVGDCKDPVSSENARKVREAVALSIERQGILDNVLGGFGRMPTRASWMLGLAQDQFEPLHPEWAWPTDIEKARQDAKALLAEAGWPNGFDMVLRVTTGHHPSAVEIGEAIAKDLEKIGVKSTIDVITYAGDRPFKVDRQRNDWWLWAGAGGAPSLAYPMPESGKLRRVPEAAFNVGFEIPEAIDLAKAMDACETQECFDKGREAMYGWWAHEHQMIPIVWSWGALGINPEKVGEWPQPTGISSPANMHHLEYIQKPR